MTNTDFRQDESRLHTGRRVLSILRALEQRVPVEGMLPSVADVRDAFEGLVCLSDCDESTKTMLIAAVAGTGDWFVFDLEALIGELSSTLDVEERLLAAEI